VDGLPEFFAAGGEADVWFRTVVQPAIADGLL
jgi:hypothetical protein